jgi:hypothetical protein
MISENVQRAKIVLFTDDTNLLFTGKAYFDLQHNMLSVMRELGIWFQKTIL